MSHFMLEPTQPIFKISQIFQGEKPPLGFYRKSKNRIEVLRYFIKEVLKKDTMDFTSLSVQDFKNHNLYGLLTTYYNCSPKKALLEAFSEEIKSQNFFEDSNLIIPAFFKNEIKEIPRNFFTKKENRQKLVEYFVKEILKKEIYQVSAKDFRNHKLNGFLTHYYNSSPIKALKEAFPNTEDFLFSKIKKTDLESLDFRKKMVNYYLKKLNLSPNEYHQVSMNQLVKSGMKLSLSRFYGGNIVKLMTDCFPHLIDKKFKFKSWKIKSF